jgi:hypothetical protein
MCRFSLSRVLTGVLFKNVLEVLDAKANTNMDEVDRD